MPPKLAPSAHLKDLGAFGYLSARLLEADIDKGNGGDGKPKREIVITLMREGAGNARDRRWYTREAVKNADAVFLARRKMFLNHLGKGQDFAEQDLEKWAATLKETWTEEGKDGKLERKGRLKIHSDWLWQRCLEAPEEIACSIEGRGAGKLGTVEGEQYTVIEKIFHLDAVKFVTYPGNATMGADLVEAAAPTPEDAPMDLKELNLAVLKEARPDLFAAIVAEITEQVKAEAAKTATRGADLNALKAELTEGYKAEVKKLAEVHAKVVDELEKRCEEAERKLDAAEVRETIRGKNTLIDRLLAESKLAPEAKTPRFVARLRGLTERKETVDGKETVVTVEAQAVAEIAEQLKLTTEAYGAVRESGPAGPSAKDLGALSVEEGSIAFQAALAKKDPMVAVQEHRAAKAQEAEAAKKA